MSFAAFYAGLAGLQANDQRLEVVGNNLANLNTVGFKTSRVNFNDIFSGVAGFDGAGNPQQIGRGVQIAAIDSIFSQGSLQSTSLLTDVAIQGSGYFVVGNNQGGLAYTRAGNFGFDNSGLLITTSGLEVQGFTEPDANGNIPSSGSLNSIQIPAGLTAPPNPTETFAARINLNSAYEAFRTTVTVFDSLGDRHDLTIDFTPRDGDLDGDFDSWDFDVTVPGDEIIGGVAGTPFSVSSGVMSFDGLGQLSSPLVDPVVNIAGGWTNGAAAQSVTWSLNDANGDGLMTGFSSPSAISSANQDGYGVGALSTLLIDRDGLISGIFTNGVNIELARLALATFNNENGLLRAGQNIFLESNASGIATIGPPNSGGRGITVSNSLELSNVDITKEFTDLIISQRGYQANSRIITTNDEVIQEALSLKR